MKKRITAAIAALVTAAAAIPLTAQAQEQKDIHITVDQVILQPEDVVPGKTVPVYARLHTPHPPLTSIEFGLTIDERCQYEIITDSDGAEILGGEPLKLEFFTSQQGNLAWQVWAGSKAKDNIGAMVMANITLPANAGYGDCFPVRYCSDSGYSPHHFKYAIDEVILYSELDMVSWEDGYILIAPSRGDINLDQSVDILDVIALNRYLLGNLSLETAGRYAADTDGTGSIDETDSLRVMKHVIGMIDLAQGD